MVLNQAIKLCRTVIKLSAYRPQHLHPNRKTSKGQTDKFFIFWLKEFYAPPPVFGRRMFVVFTSQINV